MVLRDHEPFVIEEFNGLWERGDADSVPSDHFVDCNNIQYIHSGFKTRDGLETYIAQGNVLRIYNYVMQTGDSLLILDTNGDIYHAIGQTTVYGPILSVPGAEDFGFVAIAGRAYISPFITTVDALGNEYQVGMPGEFIYVYKGDGTPARKAAGFPPTNGIGFGGSAPASFVAFNSDVDGSINKGIHLFAISIDGAELGPEVFPVIDAPGAKQVHLHNLPTDPSFASRVIYATKAIDPKDYDPDHTTYDFFEVTDITDPTQTSISIDFNDAQLTNPFSGTGAAPVTGALLSENTDTDGFSDAGFHLFGVCYETDTGYLTAPGPEVFAGITTVNIKKGIKISNIPVSPDSFVVARHIVATKVISDYNGDQKGYQFFFVPEGKIDNNVDTEITVSFYDADLLEDASHLIDNFSEIPAVVGLTTYHGRLVGYSTPSDISLVGVSAPSEPEAINSVDGLLIVPLDGQPITNAMEFRDVLYIFKSTKTVAFNDNGDVPSSWPFIILDQGVGAAVHGVSSVLDSNGVNVDYLIIADFSGVMIFNGAYARPELSWKIKDLWFNLDRKQFHKMQLANDSINQILYITFGINDLILIGDYQNGLNPKDIRWGNWTFDVEPTSIALIDDDRLVIGSREQYNP